MKEAIKMVITHFFIITVSVLFFNTIINTIGGVKEYSITFIWQIFITGVAGALPTFIFYSKKELTKRQWRLRYVFHFVIIETVILTEGCIFNWYDSLTNALTIAVMVIVVYAVVCLYSYFIEFNDANKVNSALQEFNKDEEDDEAQDC